MKSFKYNTKHIESYIMPLKYSEMIKKILLRENYGLAQNLSYL